MSDTGYEMPTADPVYRTERAKERNRISGDMANVQDLIDRTSKLMAETSEAMNETRDGSVEAELATAWEKANDCMGVLCKLRGRLETA